MTKRFSILIALALVGCSKEQPSVCEQQVSCYTGELVNPQIILVAGQSNAYNGSGFDCEIDVPLDGVYQFGRYADIADCISAAVEPLDHHRKPPEKIGFAQTFANLLYTHLGGASDVLIIPCALGGTGFSDNRWNRGDDLYQDAIDRTGAVQEMFPNGSLAAILWHQGETDVLNNNLLFEEDLDNFIENIRTDLGDTSVPFILGGMVPYWVGLDASREAYQTILRETPSRHTNVGYADPSSPFVIEKTFNEVDDIHFNAAGQRVLGKRYYDQYLLLVE